MYICRERTQLALADIGKIMGKRDHTTVIHGHDKIERDLSTNPSLRESVTEIEKRLFPNR